MSEVGRPGEEIDACVDAVLVRSDEGERLDLRIDAACRKVRRDGRILSLRSRAVGVNIDESRDAPGTTIGACGAERFPTGVLRDLRRRRRPGGKLALGEACEGLKAAAARVQSAACQRRRAGCRRRARAPAAHAIEARRFDGRERWICSPAASFGPARLDASLHDADRPADRRYQAARRRIGDLPAPCRRPSLVGAILRERTETGADPLRVAETLRPDVDRTHQRATSVTVPRRPPIASSSVS